jgi:hypothetical protein
MGIEPTLSAWEAEVLPLNYTRIHLQNSHHPRRALRRVSEATLFKFAPGEFVEPQLILRKLKFYRLQELPQNNLFARLVGVITTPACRWIVAGFYRCRTGLPTTGNIVYSFSLCCSP